MLKISAQYTGENFSQSIYRQARTFSTIKPFIHNLSKNKNPAV